MSLPGNERTKAPGHFIFAWQGYDGIVPRVLNVQHYRRPPFEEAGQTFQQRGCWMLHACVQGSLEMQILAPKSRHVLYTAGNCFISSPEPLTVRQIGSSRPDGEFIMLNVDVGKQDIFPEPQKGNSYFLFAQKKKAINSRLRAIAEAAYVDGNASFWRAQSLFAELIDLMQGMRLSDDGLAILPDKKKQDPLAKTLCRLIHEYIQKPLNVTELAEICAFSESHCARVFQESFGESIKQYMLRVRCNAVACGLQQGYSVTELADMYAFTDSTHLRKTFKRFLGCNPSEYKAAHST